MTRSNRWLNDHLRNVTSQNGEDGVIEKALEVIGTNDRYCVEFGAWDGITYSNTHHLIEDKGYSAVLIEADRQKFHQLQKNYRDHLLSTPDAGRSVELLPGVITNGQYEDSFPMLPRLLLRKCGVEGADCLDMGAMEGLIRYHGQ